MNLRVPALLRLARDQACANCGAQDGTVVAAHSNHVDHGKGWAIKANDCFTAHLCWKCHAWLDQGKGSDPTGVWGDGREDKLAMFRRAMDKTTLRLWKSGAIKVK